jgi:hypothetical protein
MLLQKIEIDRQAIYPVGVAAKATGLSREQLIAACKRGELPARLLGRNWLIGGEHLARWLIDEEIKRPMANCHLDT